MDISKYTNYCTLEQTKLASRLGAKLRVARPLYDRGSKLYKIDNKYYYKPTTQQMFGWLREVHHINLRNVTDGGATMCLDVCQYNRKISHVRDFPKQAEITAIDIALDYLEKIKS